MGKKGYFSAVAHTTKKSAVSVIIQLRRFYTILRIFVLLSLLVGFSLAGGLLFGIVEASKELAIIKSLQIARKKMLDGMYTQLTSGNSHQDTVQFDGKFKWYETLYKTAIQKGTFFVEGKPDPLWTFAGSTYFCVTTFTQIGFGNLSPSSLLGRVVAILYACLSIPVGAIVFADMGNQVNELLTIAWNVLYWTGKDIRDHAQQNDGEQYFVATPQQKAVHSLNANGDSDSNDNKSYNYVTAGGDNNGNNGYLWRSRRLDRGAIGQALSTVVRQRGRRPESLSITADDKDDESFADSPSYKPPRDSLPSGTQPGSHRGRPFRAASTVRPGVTLPNSAPFKRRVRMEKESSSGHGEGDNGYSKQNEGQKREVGRVETLLKMILSSPFCPVIMRIGYLKQRMYNKLMQRMYRESTVVTAGRNKKTNYRKTGRLGYSSTFRVVNDNNSNLDSTADDIDFFDFETQSVRSGDDLVVYDDKPIIISNIILLITYVIIGTWMTTVFEDWPYTEGMWFLIISVLTVGYGDVTPGNKHFLAWFLAYLILGIALFSNIVGTAMAFLTNTTIRMSDIGKDVYKANNARHEFHSIKERGRQARYWWRLLRHHVTQGLPVGMVLESKEYKHRLLMREKRWIKNAFRIYFQNQYAMEREDPYLSMAGRNSMFVMDGAGRLRHVNLPAFSIESTREMVDAETDYQKPKKVTIFKRMRMSMSRRYRSFKNAMVSEPHWL